MTGFPGRILTSPAWSRLPEHGSSGRIRAGRWAASAEKKLRHLTVAGDVCRIDPVAMICALENAELACTPLQIFAGVSTIFCSIRDSRCRFLSAGFVVCNLHLEVASMLAGHRRNNSTNGPKFAANLRVLDPWMSQFNAWIGSKLLLQKQVCWPNSVA